jgi:hypothetical protein
LTPVHRLGSNKICARFHRPMAFSLVGGRTA